MSDYRTSFNGERLKSARLYNAMTISDVAELVDISKQAISQFETNKSEPKWETIIKISSVLKFPRDYFYEKNEEQVIVGDTYFRSLSSTTNKERHAQIERVKLLVQIINVINEYIEFPELMLYDMSEETELDVEKIADGVRKVWGLQDKPINNLIDEMERHGVIVSSIFTNTQNIDAYSQIQQVNGKTIAVVVLGSDKDNAFRRNFNAAHELGHLIMDDFFNINDMSKLEHKEMEELMNKFAGALLIPRNEFARDLNTSSKTELNYYIQLKRKYHVSAAALIVRANQLGLITLNQYQYLMKQLSQRGYRTCEPFDKETPTIKPRYIKHAMKMIIEEDEVSSNEFLYELGRVGVSLAPEMVEQLLNLPEGYLSQNSESGKVIELQRR